MTDKSRKAVPREPTDTMGVAGYLVLTNKPDDGGYKCVTHIAEAVWRAMYDAAPVLATKDGEVAALIERIDAMLIAERAIVVAHNSDDAGIDDIGQITKQHSHALAQRWRELKLAITGAGAASVESLADVSADGPMQAKLEPGGTRLDRFGQPSPSPAPTLAALIERLERAARHWGHEQCSDRALCPVCGIADLFREAADALARLSAPVPDKEKLESEIDELASKHRGEYLIRCGYEAVLRRLLNAQIVPQEPEADDPKWEAWRELDDAITAARESLGESAAAPVPDKEK